MKETTLEAEIKATAYVIGDTLATKKFHTKFDVLEPPRELTAAGRERFKEAQRNKRRAHYEACVRAEREFVEEQLRLLTAKALYAVSTGWTPTAANINALPEPIRRYIHDVETRCDPTGLVQENTVLKDSMAALAKRVEELEGMVADAVNAPAAAKGAFAGITTPETLGAGVAKTFSEQFHLHIKPGDQAERTSRRCPEVDCPLYLLRFTRAETGVSIYVCPQHGGFWGSPEEVKEGKE